MNIRGSDNRVTDVPAAKDTTVEFNHSDKVSPFVVVDFCSFSALLLVEVKLPGDDQGRWEADRRCLCFDNGRKVHGVGKGFVGVIGYIFVFVSKTVPGYIPEFVIYKVCLNGSESQRLRVCNEGGEEHLHLDVLTRPDIGALSKRYDLSADIAAKTFAHHTDAFLMAPETFRLHADISDDGDCVQEAVRSQSVVDADHVNIGFDCVSSHQTEVLLVLLHRAEVNHALPVRNVFHSFFRDHDRLGREGSRDPPILTYTHLVHVDVVRQIGFILVVDYVFFVVVLDPVFIILELVASLEVLDV